MKNSQDYVLSSQMGHPSLAPYQPVPRITMSESLPLPVHNLSKDKCHTNTRLSHCPEQTLSCSLPSKFYLSGYIDNDCLNLETPFHIKTDVNKCISTNKDPQIPIPSSVSTTSLKCGKNNCRQNVNSKNEMLLSSCSSNLYFVSSTSLPALIAAPLNTDCFRRSHRHSIPGHRLSNYLKFLNELSAKGSSTVHLFSTAVISGSSSAPNLKEMPRPGECHSKYYDT